MYVVDDTGVDIQDADGCLKNYQDADTKSGNAITRTFCQKCGSPIYSASEKSPGKKVIKASLFDKVATARKDIFLEDEIKWA
ncbi:hypothetical protein HIM_03585 [Hirsutella minnesotensis 3608]|uniref:CENP-V/GFA domain-containing protein n=1 Tax=Hirsutella minnesotensis 3608 TaxID=1043627 RepID=A0A0F8A6L0_9HYPO|nr:hypothetical protein HIM_03585 [Hirsutella minnesotensis 3608]